MAKILIYAMNYAPETVGVGRYTAEIAAYLADSGDDVVVVTTPPHYPEWRLRSPYAPYRWYTERCGRATILRCPLYLPNKKSGIWRLIPPLSFAINSAPVVIWRILTGRPEVVLCVEPTLIGAPALLLAARLVGVTSVLHVQDLEVDAAFAVGRLPDFSSLKAFAFAFERFCLRRFDRVVTISTRMAEQLIAKGVEPDRLAVVRNWVDLDRIRPITGASGYRRELGFGDGDRIVLYSGALGAKQGLETALDAIARLSNRPDIKFVLAGEGPAKAQVEARAAALPNLTVLPIQPEDRLNEFLGLADVHLLPQSAAVVDLALPSKLGGMLASGRPIVATAPAGSEIATFLGDAAICVTPGDPDALARALVETLDCRDDNRAQIGRRAALAARLSKTEALRALAGGLTNGAPAGRAEGVATRADLGGSF